MKRLAVWGAASVIGAVGAAAAIFLEPGKGSKRRTAAKKVTKKATAKGATIVRRERAHVAAMAATVRPHRHPAAPAVVPTKRTPPSDRSRAAS